MPNTPALRSADSQPWSTVATMPPEGGPELDEAITRQLRELEKEAMLAEGSAEAAWARAGRLRAMIDRLRDALGRPEMPMPSPLSERTKGA